MTKAEKVLVGGAIIGAIIVAWCALTGKEKTPAIVTGGGTGTVTAGTPTVTGSSATAGGTDYLTPATGQYDYNGNPANYIA